MSKRSQQQPLPLYLGKPFLSIKKYLRNPKSRELVDQAKSLGIEFKNLRDSGSIQSAEACLQISAFLQVLGID